MHVERAATEKQLMQSVTKLEQEVIMISTQMFQIQYKIQDYLQVPNRYWITITQFKDFGWYKQVKKDTKDTCYTLHDYVKINTTFFTCGVSASINSWRNKREFSLT